MEDSVKEHIQTRHSWGSWEFTAQGEGGGAGLGEEGGDRLCPLLGESQTG